MGRRPEPTTTQAEPTRPPAADAAGRPVDAWGLPFNGPARAAALADAGKRDPNDHPDDWAAPAASTPTAEA